MAERLYGLIHCAASPHWAESWLVDGTGKGFGLRSFPTRARAVDAATAFFGTAKLTLTLRPGSAELLCALGPDTDHASALSLAIAALQDARAALQLQDPSDVS